MAGRYRMPASLKVRHDVTKEEKERMAEQEQALAGGNDRLYDVPEWIDDLAVQYYMYIIDELELAGILCNLDKFVITQIAQSLSDIQKLTQEINENGMVLDGFDKQGNPVKYKNPAYAMRDTAHKQFKSLAMQLGLSPTARAQLTGLQMQKKADDTDPVVQALSGL